MAKWYCLLADVEHGPLSDAQFKTLAENGTIERLTQVRRENDGMWSVAEQVKGLFDSAPGKKVPPPFPTAITASAVPTSKPAIHPTQLQSELHQAMADDYGYEIRNHTAMGCLTFVVTLSFIGSVLAMIGGAENESGDVFAAGIVAFISALACAAGLVILKEFISLLAIIAVELRLIRKRLSPPAAGTAPSTERPESASPTLR